MSKPNFLILIADDLGFSDLGCYGGEIHTPNLDALAKDGLRMTGFHTASACSPTRAMLLSGTDSHLAGLGQMYHKIHQSEESVKYYESKVGYEGILNRDVAALSEILNEDKGYRTLLSGKWHLGLDEASLPSARGFERNWGLLPGCWHHFKYTPTNKDGFHHPRFMQNKFADGSRIFKHTELPEDFYSSTTYTDKMLEWLEEKDDRPFFAMMTYTAPHWPLQAPKEYTDKYKGRYDAGPAALRGERLAKLVELGLVPQHAVDHAHRVVKAWQTRDWDELPEHGRQRNSKIMEVYAGMVECLDYNIGRSTGQLDNTFVLFSMSFETHADSVSDNGAEGGILEAAPISGERHRAIVEEYYDNSVENIGNANSFVYYGPRWAQAATAPSRMYKGWITEGGIRCPCIVRYPKMGANTGAISHAFTTVMDICPTVLELAGIPHPGSTFQGRKVHKPKGVSWWPWLQGKQELVHDDNHAVGWELFGQQAIRRGPWKAVFIPEPTGPERWELYNLNDDPGETHDLYQEREDILSELLVLWEEYEAETGMVKAFDRQPKVEGFGLKYEHW